MMKRGFVVGVVATLCEHDEAESKVLFLCWWVVETGSFGALPLGPSLMQVILFFVATRKRSGGWWTRIIESLQSHMNWAMITKMGSEVGR